MEFDAHRNSTSRVLPLAKAACALWTICGVIVEWVIE